MISLIVILTLFAVSALLLFTIYVYLVLRKTHNLLYMKKKQSWLEAHADHIQVFLLTGEGASAFIPEKKYQFEALEDKFSEYLSNFQYDVDFNPIRDFVNSYMVKRYKKLLKDRRWSVRMNTLYFIDLFRIDSLSGHLRRHLNKPFCSPEERYQIYIILVEFNGLQMIDQLQKETGMPNFLLTELLTRILNQDNVDQFVDEFENFSAQWQGAILDIVRDKNLRSEKLQQLLEQSLHSDDPERVVRSLKSLASLAYISSPILVVNMMERFVETGFWQQKQATGIRLMTARLFGSIRYKECLPYLFDLISDREYVVRSEAAKAIRQYTDGRIVLEQIAAAHEDEFARNISQEWIERRVELD